MGARMLEGLVCSCTWLYFRGLPVVSSKVETPYIEPVLNAVQQLASGLVAEAVQIFSNLAVQC